MKTLVLSVLAFFFAVAVSMAQNTLPNNYSSTSDVLGAHLLYGRGCIGCHAPHNGAGGNGVTTSDSTSGNNALWGEDLTPLYNQTLGFGDNGSFAVAFPANGSGITSAFDPTTVVMLCLSCHDGNLAKVGWMKGTTVETLPIVGGHAPTLLGNDGTTAGNYHNDHPVGPQAIIGCGGTFDWDCTSSGGKIVVPSGTAFKQFTEVNYGWAVSPATVNGNPTVTCTTCHDQHSMTVWAGNGHATGKGTYYQTSFFVRGPYQPQTGGNNAAQFCRQCHGGESNEMHNAMNVPTT